MPGLRSSFPRLVLLLLFALPQTSCIRIAERLATNLAERSVKRSHFFNLVEGDLARFRQCMKSEGGICASTGATAKSLGPGPTQFKSGNSLQNSVAALPDNHPAKAADQTLQNPILACAAVVHDHIAGNQTEANPDCQVSGEGKDSTVNFNVSLSQAQKLLEDAHRASASGGWEAYSQHAKDHLLSRLTSGTSGHDRVKKDHHKLVYIREYVKAYFRNGRIVSVDLQIDKEKAIADIASQLDKHSPLVCKAFNAAQAAAQSGGGQTPPAASSDCQAFAAEIYTGVLGGSQLAQGQPIQLVSVSDVGFKPRDGGVGYQFPQINVNIDPLQSPVVQLQGAGNAPFRLNFTAVGTDLIRVLIQAVFDAREGLPAASGATGLSFPEAEKDFELPAFQPVSQGSTGVDIDDFNTMRGINQGAGAAAGVIIDRVIRGIGPISLNNEALEQLITSVVATTVQKAFEKVTWCFYSCNINVDLEKARTALGQDIDSAPGRLEGRLAAYGHDVVEKVRMNFSTSN